MNSTKNKLDHFMTKDKKIYDLNTNPFFSKHMSTFISKTFYKIKY
jgi:hypothetical protein